MSKPQSSPPETRAVVNAQGAATAAVVTPTTPSVFPVRRDEGSASAIPAVAAGNVAAEGGAASGESTDAEEVFADPPYWVPVKYLPDGDEGVAAIAGSSMLVPLPKWRVRCVRSGMGGGEGGREEWGWVGEAEAA